jgi:hypothetical protein
MWYVHRKWWPVAILYAVCMHALDCFYIEK